MLWNRFSNSKIASLRWPLTRIQTLPPLKALTVWSRCSSDRSECITSTCSDLSFICNNKSYKCNTWRAMLVCVFVLYRNPNRWTDPDKTFWTPNPDLGPMSFRSHGHSLWVGVDKIIAEVFVTNSYLVGLDTPYPDPQGPGGPKGGPGGVLFKTSFESSWATPGDPS